MQGQDLSEPSDDRLSKSWYLTDETNVDGISDRLYDELRQLAAAIFAEQHASHLLQPTALVHEVWLKLAGKAQDVESRTHLLALCAKAMRQVLIDYARHGQRQKRGGNAVQLTFSDSRYSDDVDTVDLVDFHEALAKLGELNERHAQVAELRLLGSLSVDEIAGVLGVNPRTVKRDWQAARLWLQSEIEGP